LFLPVTVTVKKASTVQFLAFFEKNSRL